MRTRKTVLYIKQCPKCHATVTQEAVVCYKCKYRFPTERKFQQTDLVADYGFPKVQKKLKIGEGQKTGR